METKLSIKQARQMKESTETLILEMILDLEQETGLEVKNIRLEWNENAPTGRAITLEIEL